MRRYICFLSILASLFLLGCKVDYEININNDLSGTCVARVLTMGMITKDGVTQELQQKGLTNYSVSEFTENVSLGGGQSIPMQGMQIKSSWSNAAQLAEILRAVAGVNAGMALRKNADGSVSVLLGALASEGGKARIHVDGKIDPTSTRGVLIGSSSVEFGSGQQVAFSFQPVVGLPRVIKIIGIILCLAFVAALCLYAFKRKRKDMMVTASVGSSITEISSINKRFCSECGATAGEGDKFCSGCGNQL